MCLYNRKGGSVVKSFETVYQTHRVAIYHTAVSFLHDPSAAEDVMHDVFLTYYEHLQTESPIRNLRAWLLTVTRNRCRNILRTVSREQPEDDPSTPDAADLSPPLHERGEIEQLLTCLTDEEKLVFSLHCLDGYTYRELSVGLDMPIGTIQTRCHTARKKLKQAIKNTDFLSKGGNP